MDREETTLFIPYTLLRNNKISNYAMMVYCYLQKLTTTSGENIHYVSAYSIACYLTGQVEHPRKFLDNIKQAILDLIKVGILYQVQEIGKTNQYFAIDCSRLWINTEKERFVIVYYDEILKIMRSDISNKPIILKYFIFLMGTLMTKVEVTLPSSLKRGHVVGRYTIAALGEQFGVSEYSILFYNKTLEDEQLIYIYRHNGFVMNEVKGLQSLPNIYGRYENKKFVDVYGQQYFEECDFKKYGCRYSSNSDQKRSLAQRYQQLIKGRGNNYSEKEILEIYNYIVEENQKYAAIYFDNQECLWAFEKIRDIDIFESYDFIDTTEAQKLIDKIYGVVNNSSDDNDDI